MGDTRAGWIRWLALSLVAPLPMLASSQPAPAAAGSVPTLLHASVAFTRPVLPRRIRHARRHRFLRPLAVSGNLSVASTADIFASGQSTVAQQGGTLPPSIPFTPGASQVLTIATSGTVTCDATATSPYNGADGPCYTNGSTNISSYGGISGIVDSQSTYFLVGVFLDDNPPSSTAPPSLDFSPGATGQNFLALAAPQLGQTFFIGDGLTGTGNGMAQQFVVPSTATRLFLGFADACQFQGTPDCYGDDGGQLSASVSISPGNPAAPTTPETYAGGSSSEPSTTCGCGDPVNTASGDFWHTFEDLPVPGRGMALALTRTYNSLTASQDSPFGFGWTDSYNMFLSTDSGGDVVVHEGNGSQEPFVWKPAGYTPPARVFATLVDNGNGTLTFSRKDHTRYLFGKPTSNAMGRLLSEKDPNGYTTTLAYDGAGRLQTVTDPEGRSLTFAYTDTRAANVNHVTTVTDAAGRSVRYGYDANGNLTDFYDLGRADTGTGHAVYGYDGSHLLLTMQDPAGHLITNSYNSSGQVLSQAATLTSGNRTTQFSYATNSDGTTQTTVTDPKGNVTLFTYSANELIKRVEGSGTASDLAVRLRPLDR